jgi:2-methylcitrate dehydratase
MRSAALPDGVVHEAKRRLIDTLGCALGGVDSPPAVIARGLASEASVPRGARILGATDRTTPELAAFGNVVMARYLDFNDSFASARASGGHPSDMIPAILAVADAAHASGDLTLRALVAAYQANAAVPVPFKKRGWDQGIMTGIGVAIGASVIAGLEEAATADAISLTVAPNVPLRVTRSGELSMWKACATAAAGHSAIFATRLAAAGMTGPDEVFEGRHGLWEQATGPFELELDPAQVGYRVLDVDTKLYPVEGGVQPVLPALLELTDGLSVEDIEAVDVRTYWGLWFEAASEPQKWDPKTRETADHSLPYIMAVALRDRTITLGAFDPATIADPTLRPLMGRITVTEVPEFTGDNPTILGTTEIEVRTASGERRIGRSGIARGNHRNPMTDEELVSKFMGLALPLAPRPRCDALIDGLWAFDGADDVSPIVEAWADLVPAP